MLMAKASEADLNMAMDLCGMLDGLGHRFCPSMPVVIARDGDEDFDRNDDAQCGRALRVLLETLEGGSLMRVVWGCAVMLDPSNTLVDPDADTIQHHPERKRAIDLLRAILGTHAGVQTLAQLADGQGTNTDEGRVWLEARAFLDETDGKAGPGSFRA